MNSMRYCWVFVLVALVLLPASGWAQGEDTLKLIDLEVPDSPAFALIGIAPASISRPITPKAFALTLLDSTSNSGDGIPKDLAIEISPYWARSKSKGRTFSHYYKSGQRGNVIFRTLSVSLGTSELETSVGGTDIDTTRAAVGLRFNLFEGKLSEKFWDYEQDDEGPEIKNYRKLLRSTVDFVGEELIPAKDALRKSVRDRLTGTDKFGPGDGSNKYERYDKFMDDLSAADDDSAASLMTKEFEATIRGHLKLRSDEPIPPRVALALNNLAATARAARGSARNILHDTRAQLEKLAKERHGFTLQVAGAVAYDFSNNDTGEEEFSRAGAWVTAGYTPVGYTPKEGEMEPSRFTFLGLGRYIFDEAAGGDSKFDVGARIIYETKGLPLRFSAEYLDRFGDVSEERAVALVEYQIKDDRSLYASFGTTFDDDFVGDEDLVAILGVNIGLGKSGLRLNP